VKVPLLKAIQAGAGEPKRNVKLDEGRRVMRLSMPSVRLGDVRMKVCPLVNFNPSGQGFGCSFRCPLGHARADRLSINGDEVTIWSSQDQRPGP
jgi:hypothetical protein